MNAIARVFVVLLLNLVVVVGYGSAGAANEHSDNCLASLSKSAKASIDRTYKGWRLLRLDDLGADDRELWKRAHGDLCPSIAMGKFFPGQKPSVAVLLVRADDKPRRVRIVVVKEVSEGKMSLRTVLENTVTNYPVIHTEGPGTYRSFYGDKKIDVSNDVIVYEHLETRTLALYYTKDGFKRLLVSD